MRRFLSWTLAGLLTTVASVQANGPAPLVGEREIEDAKARVRLPSEADIEAVRRSLQPLLRSDLPAPPATGAGSLPALDPAGLAAQSAKFASALTSEMLRAGQGAGLLVFVSFSLPRTTLQALVDQAEQTGATLVLRGVRHRSLHKTMLEVRELIGERRVAWVIDPTAFERFDVAVVPSFVLTAPQLAAASCTQRECMAPEAFAKVAGEVPIARALEEMQARAPALREAATLYLKKAGSSWR